jgi:hypothetical protein
MEVFGSDLIAEYIVMMERPSRTLKVKRFRNEWHHNGFFKKAISIRQGNKLPDD